jgi:translation initiation factor IF-3
MANNDTSFTRINQQIRASEVRLISSSGENLGIKQTWEAIKLAKEEGLDLVEINSKSVPVVCRITDYGKMKYEQTKQAKEARKNQKTNEVREIAFRPTTDEHDIAHKLAKAREFLAEGARVRMVVKFRGREISHMDLGKQRLDEVIAALADLTASYTPYTTEGKAITTIVSPKQSQ